MSVDTQCVTDCTGGLVQLTEFGGPLSIKTHGDNCTIIINACTSIEISPLREVLGAVAGVVPSGECVVTSLLEVPAFTHIQPPFVGRSAYISVEPSAY